MPIELADIQLNRIHKIATLEQAAFVYHRIPGLEGDVTQDLGRASVRLQIEGIFYGRPAKRKLEKLRTLHIKREPVDFIADILGKAYAAKVTLDRFEVIEAAREPGQYSYWLIVSEYVQPPKAAPGPTPVEQQLRIESKSMLEMASLPDALAFGSLPEISNPFNPLKGALDPVQEATKGLFASISGLKTLLDA
jgi:hypothetical protein